MIYLLGIDHSYQYDPGKRDVLYRKLKRIIKEKNISILLEEYNKDAGVGYKISASLIPQKNNLHNNLSSVNDKELDKLIREVDDQQFETPTEEIAKKYQLKYEMIDPGIKDRQKLKIPPVEDNREENFQKRETFWLKHIKKYLGIGNILLIIGTDHLSSFGSRLEKGNIRYKKYLSIGQK